MTAKIVGKVHEWEYDPCEICNEATHFSWNCPAERERKNAKIAGLITYRTKYYRPGQYLILWKAYLDERGATEITMMMEKLTRTQLAIIECMKASEKDIFTVADITKQLKMRVWSSTVRTNLLVLEKAGYVSRLEAEKGKPHLWVLMESKI